MGIVIDGSEKIFNKRRVLADISLTANDGEILGLIGPSGAGKTTLIRLITGVLNADAGKIIIDNVEVPSRKLLKQVGFMPQADALYENLSGADNLRFFGRLYGLSGEKLTVRCNELFRFVELYDDKDKPVSEYSDEMKKRLSLIIALVHDPKHIVLDEPTADADPKLRKKIWGIFSELAQQGKSIIVSSHVTEEAVGCTKCALMRDGKIIALDTPDALSQLTEHGSIGELFFEKEGTE